MKKIICALFITASILFSLVSCVDLGAFTSSSQNNTGTGNNNDNTQNTDSGNNKNESAELTAEYIYSLAKREGYTGTLEEFIEEFRGEPGENGTDGVGIASAAFDENSHLMLTLTNGTVIDCGKIAVSVVGSDGSSISIGSNGNWYIDGVDSGVSAKAEQANKWHTGSGAPSSLIGSVGDLYLNTANGDVYEKKDSFWQLITNISGDGFVNNEGDSYDVTVNVGTDANAAKYAAAKGLLSAVIVESIFSSGSILYQSVSNGAGVIYKLDKETGDAYVITNFHVVYGQDALTPNNIADEINIYLYGMEYSDYKIPATYVGGSLNYDIAVLKVTGNEILKNSVATAVELRDSSDVRVLDTAIAIGNPMANGLSATLGSVNVESEYLSMTGADGQTPVEFRVMRIDTPVNSGNSGGGVFDINGKLIGIINAKEVAPLENIGYAIPSNLAVAVAENIIRNCDGKANEQVIKCVIGIMITIGDIDVKYDTDTGLVTVKHTCIISEINPGSIAEVELMVNDVILSFEIDGVTYEINNTYDGGESLLYADPDSEVFVNIMRGSETKRVELHITEANFSAVK